MTDPSKPLKELFLSALEVAPNDRAEWLDRECDEDAGLREQLNLMLAAHDSPHSLLDQPALVEPGAAIDPPITQPGDTIGPYKLLEVIGEGGFGVVYRAEQTQPVRRQVALKIIKPGMDTRDVIARFEAERQALALMDHPCIAKVFDAGAAENGRPYFVMELVKGIPITEYCDQCNLPTRERLELFLEVCQAVQHAHQKGIIHRDIKPTNVLVAMQDGQPVPKIIDFGVAKAINQRLTEHTLVTTFAQMVGTPMYMSPEQAQMSPMEVDTRTDIYSLGVLLYELLTGTTPFENDRLKEAAFDELRRIIREEEPPRPSSRISTMGAADLTTIAEHRRTEEKKLRQTLLGDLDWIVMKCLEKDRTRRYETANGLARDIERFLNDEPVEASPPSATYRFRKFARRNKPVLMTTAVVLIALLAGAVVSAWQAARATKAERMASQSLIAERVAHQEAELGRHEALRERKTALDNLYLAHMRLAHQEWKRGHVQHVLNLLERHGPAAGQSDRRGWEWYYLKSLCHTDLFTLRGHADAALRVRWSPDGTRLASTSADHTVKVWNGSTGDLLLSLRLPGPVYSSAWSPDGRFLVTGGHDGTIKFWDLSTSQVTRQFKGHDYEVISVDWNPKRQELATADHSTVKIWDSETGQLKGMQKQSGVTDAVWNVDGTHIGWVSNDGSVKVWDTNVPDVETPLRWDAQGVLSLAWNPDGRRVALSNHYQLITVWDLVEKKKIFSRTGHVGSIRAVDWSSDGRRLASASHDGTIRVWDGDTGEELSRFRGHTGPVYSVSWHPDGQRVASASDDGTVRIWGLDSQAITPDAAVEPVAWSPDGKRLAFGVEETEDGRLRRQSGQRPVRAQGRATIRIFDVSTRKPLVSLTCEENAAWVPSIAWDREGRRLAAADSSGTVTVWDSASHQLLLRIQADDLSETREVAWSPDGRRIATAGADRAVKIWDAATGEQLLALNGHQDTVGSVAWSPNGRQLASSSWDGDVKLWEFPAGHERFSFSEPTGVFGWGASGVDGQHSIVWRPDGERLAAGTRDGEIVLWSTATGEKVMRLHGHTANVRSLSWSHDGRRLGSGSDDHTIKIWEPETGTELLTLEGHASRVYSVSWSPDGRRLASAGPLSVRIWDATPAYELVQETDYHR